MFQKNFAKTIQLLSLYAAEPEDSEEWKLKKVIGVLIFFMAMIFWLGYGWRYWEKEIYL